MPSEYHLHKSKTSKQKLTGSINDPKMPIWLLIWPHGWWLYLIIKLGVWSHRRLCSHLTKVRSRRYLLACWWECHVERTQKRLWSLGRLHLLLCPYLHGLSLYHRRKLNWPGTICSSQNHVGCYPLTFTLPDDCKLIVWRLAPVSTLVSKWNWLLCNYHNLLYFFPF